MNLLFIGDVAIIIITVVTLDLIDVIKTAPIQSLSDYGYCILVLLITLLHEIRLHATAMNLRRV